ncbi:MAG: phosphoribosyl-ATP diphosphatase [Hyphomonadaceae bacterium]|nr:phosphoribosyl-ATP diphosphatase [Hyphomonadaceae bacterium]
MTNQPPPGAHAAAETRTAGETLGGALDALALTIASRRDADPATSYTASLLHAGPARCAKKLGEEGVEAALAAVSGDKAALAGEAADVLFHLMITLEACGVSPAAVAAALNARKGVSGHDEKKNRPGP